MKSLLNSKKLLSEPRVVAVAKAMGLTKVGNYHDLVRPLMSEPFCPRCGTSGDAIKLVTCHERDYIPGSLADVAFQMRDACDDGNRWLNELIVMMTQFDTRPCGRTVAKNASSKQWIIAAVRIWEAKK